MRPDANGTVLTQEEFLHDYGDEAGQAAWEVAPTVFDPDTVQNVDEATGRDLSAETPRAKVKFWRDKRDEHHSAAASPVAAAAEPVVSE